MDSLRSIFVVLMLCFLSGCCGVRGGAAVQASSFASWDGFGAPPAAFGNTRNKEPMSSRVAPARSKVAPSSAMPNPFISYSKEWWEIEERSAQIEEARMAKLLIICKGCVEDRNLIPDIKGGIAGEHTLQAYRLAPLPTASADSARPSGGK